jgi:hypothetical protein
MREFTLECVGYPCKRAVEYVWKED